MAAGLLAGCGWLVRGELEPWAQRLATGPASAALFRTVAMPGGSVSVPRPPSEARPALTELLTAAPRDAMLYRLRAQEAEAALDFTAAEADWKSYAASAPDRYAAQWEVADFYHRRGRPADEIAVLTAAAQTPDDPLLAANAQRGWRAFERITTVAGEESMPQATAAPIWRAFVARYPKEREPWRSLIARLQGWSDFAGAESEIAKFDRAFHDEFETVRMRADLELQRNGATAAAAVYDRAFRPLWPEGMRSAYFKLLEQEGLLREFAGRARAALESNPADLDATSRLFHYYRSQNNAPAARRALLQYRMAKESGQRSWTPEELETAAQLFEWLPDVNEAARLYYALYSLPPANGPHVERAIAGLANLLLTAPDQPIQFGSGDLSFYKDIATVDPSPGFLNGILSLVLNGSGIRWRFPNVDANSAAHFHRAAGARLVALLDQRFPRSARRDPLRAALVSAYGVYGDDASVIRAGREYLAAFPAGASRVPVAMQVADALARAERVDEEFALYAQLLRELATRASNVPIGDGQTPARSGEYVQVLDKYLARLAGLNRRIEILAVYRGEIDRNPNDPGLYERLAGFVEQSGVSREVEDVYTKAIAKFADRSWTHKLARWHLRSRQAAELERISRQAVSTFSGAELELYFGDVVAAAYPDAALYRQLNLYAHQRFPQDMVFVRNLLNAYSHPETADAAAADRLIREYWFYDPLLRTMFFERLSRAGRLYPELAEVRTANPGIVNGQLDRALAQNPAAVQFATEAEGWLSHFEAAAPAARALATAYPGNREFTGRASSLYRSLAAYDRQATETAIAITGLEQKARPKDVEVLARMGDILADASCSRGPRRSGTACRSPSRRTPTDISTPRPSTGITTVTTTPSAGSRLPGGSSGMRRCLPIRPALSMKGSGTIAERSGSMSPERSTATMRRGGGCCDWPGEMQPARSWIGQPSRLRHRKPSPCGWRFWKRSSGGPKSRRCCGRASKRRPARLCWANCRRRRAGSGSTRSRNGRRSG